MGVKTAAALTLVLSLGNALAQQPVRDPFATLSNAPKIPESLALTPDERENSRELKLKAILWSARPLANISGMIVAPNDRVHDYTVIQLSRKTAVLRRADETILLVLEEGS